MNCQEVRMLIDGYVDGELDPIRNREIEQHFQTCPACSTVFDSHRVLRTALRTGSLYRTAPLALRNRVRSSFKPTPTRKSLMGLPQWRWVAVAASLAFVSVLTWRVALFLPAETADHLLIEEVTASHVRSLMVSHLVDIPSSDRHVVKPWFTGKLDFAPSVADLTEQGFPLVGGRLDYVNGRAVAGLVYKRREHVINVFLWPSAATVETRPIAHQGYHLVCWTQSGMTHWAISDLNSRELQEFVHLLQNPPSH
ncbi:MAG: anti-sigma factor [Nitrospira sp.]|nr:anti-sigma factor [Nitrospira sp.]